MASGRKTTLSFNYSDRFSTLMLWWKAFFLLPVWGYAALPILGSIVAFFGLLSVTFTTVIIGGVVYFLEDVLKRKVRIDDQHIVHGFRKRDLTKLLSIGTVYKRNEVLPKKMILTFCQGKSLEFRLSRINASAYQRFLKHIESNYPQCLIDPVLQTLISCKKVARKVLIDDGDRFVIEYKSERSLLDLWRAFLDTAHPWLRIGPLFIVCAMSPGWVCFVTTCLFLPLNWEATGEASRLAGQLTTVCGPAVIALVAMAGFTGSQVLGVLSNPVVAVASLLVLVFLVVTYVARLFLRPNSLILDKGGLTLALSIMGNTIVCDRIDWSSIVSADKGRKSDGKVKISFALVKGKPFEIELSSVIENDRPRLAKALERFAPMCSIDSELAEAMMPRRERSYTELWLQSLSAPPERNSLQALTPGQRLENDRYLVVRRLAVGGQGTAYLCQDQIDKCDVVLKETVVPIFADRIVKEQALKRFDQEAKILQSLDSEHIVSLRDHFFEDHRGYLVLEHIAGKTLRQLVEEEGCLSEERVMALAQQMCLILSYLHERNIVHRDFTPDNLILTDDGRLKLIDFNVAQTVQVGTTGTIAGKHAYLPPEQFRGKATQQSDIYALGATLYFLAAGHDPEPISQSSPVSDGVPVSSGLDQLIRDCTALDCAKRCHSIRTFEESWQGVKSGCVFAAQEATAAVANVEQSAAVLDVRRAQDEERVYLSRKDGGLGHG